MSFAFVFPGQGSQSVGMLQALAAADSSVRTTCDEASQVLGYDLWKLVSEGPEETLNATEQTQPAMLAVEDEAVEAACREAARGAVVEAANFNSPGQVVIAGDKAAVERAIEAARTRGAKRAVRLPVSVPSHSSLMRGAAARLREKLAAIDLRAPRIRYVSAVDARPHERPEEIRELLVLQLSSPVRWTDTLRALAARDLAQIIECGPGKVLTGLNRRIERRPNLNFLALDDPAPIEAALSATRRDSHA